MSLSTLKKKKKDFQNNKTKKNQYIQNLNTKQKNSFRIRYYQKH
jgi:hypothetical protein